MIVLQGGIATIIGYVLLQAINLNAGVLLEEPTTL